MTITKEYNDRHNKQLVNPGFTLTYNVYIIKHVTGYHMRYGIYTSLKEASDALQYASKVNPIDSFYIQEIHNSLSDNVK